ATAAVSDVAAKLFKVVRGAVRKRAVDIVSVVRLRPTPVSAPDRSRTSGRHLSGGLFRRRR
ncbi:MAG: hypothetical protein MPJ82_07055, partial [Alphaproteobacteria bacterium]|nr:hypothetical protein [Alphaproteobacteria bacterium]